MPIRSAVAELTQFAKLKPILLPRPVPRQRRDAAQANYVERTLMPHRKVRILAAICLVASALTLSFVENSRASTTPPVSISPYAITPGAPWADTSGNLIQGHNGTILSMPSSSGFGNTYYWIGQDIQGTSPATDRHSVACYASTDLVHWAFQNDILTPSNQTSVANWPSTYLIGAVKVLYNASTKRYVLWGAIETGQAPRTTSELLVDVATGGSPCGSYSWVGDDSTHLPFQPQGENAGNQASGDVGLFEDANGTAYLLTEDRGPDKGLYIYALNADFTRINKGASNSTDGVVERFSQDYEAPAMFNNNGTYYVFASATTNWAPNDDKYTTLTANSLPKNGSWSSWNDLVPTGTTDPRTCDSQTMDVLQIQGAVKTSYIYIGDRWDFPNLYDSGFVWLPITFTSLTPSIDCTVGTWSVNTFTGETDVLNEGPYFTFTSADSADSGGAVMEEPSR